MKRRIALLGALVVALRYFFDPRNGENRRKMLRDRLASFRQKTTHEEFKLQPDDASLVDKVRSEIFRDVDIPSAQININAEHGKVVLRGEVEQPELIEQLVERTRNVHGVREVENLLHVPS